MSADPSTSLIKLRQYAELMAKLVAAKTATWMGEADAFSDILRRLKAERVLPPSAADLFHRIKGSGNDAAHALTGTHAEALRDNEAFVCDDVPPASSTA